MNALQLIVQELDEKYNLTGQKPTNGSIKDPAEYSFVCGSISSIISIKDVVVQLEKRIDEDE
mgnify:FL=1